MTMECQGMNDQKTGDDSKIETRNIIKYPQWSSTGAGRDWMMCMSDIVYLRRDKARVYENRKFYEIFRRSKLT